MSVNLSPLAGAGWQFFDNNGLPLGAGLLYTYAAGTSTPQATYTTSAGSVANSNPIVLDASGRSANEIWLTTGQSYKFVLQTSAAVQIWSFDNISGINDITVATATNLTVSGTLTASGTLTGSGFTNYFAAPPAIGGTTPANGTFTNLTATVASTLPTAGQFDNSTSGATTAFVQRALGNLSSVTFIGTTQTLTNVVTGSLVYCTPTSNIILTLPLANSLPTGTQINFVNINPSTVQLVANGANVINFIGSGASVSPYLSVNDTATLIWTGSVWNIIGGSIEWQYQSARFGASLTSNGYQKLPSGLYMQWGQAVSSGTSADNVSVTYPTAFPTGTLRTYAILAGSPSSGSFTVAAGSSTTSTAAFTTLSGGSPASGVTINWFALGY